MRGLSNTTAPRKWSDGWTTKGVERSVALSVATIFVAVFVFHADLHATAGPIFIVTPVVSAPVRAVPASIVAIAPFSVSSAVFVAIPIRITVAMHSPVWTHFAVVAAMTIIAAAAHAPIALHLTIICPRLVAFAWLLPLLLGTLVRLGRNRLRRRDRRFALLFGEQGAEAR